MAKLKAEMELTEELRHLEGRRRSLSQMISRSNSQEKREALKMELWNIRRRQDRLSSLNREIM